MTATEMLGPEIEEMAKRLRLPHIRRGFGELALTAKAQRWDPLELIRVLLELEIQGRSASTLQVRRATANLPGNRSLAGFDHALSSVATHTINGLATLSWVKNKENVVIVGPPGTGKSYLAEVLASEAIEAGMRVAWFEPEVLFDAVALGRETDTLKSFLLRLQRLDLVILDDLGILPLTPRDSEAMYRVVNACYEVTSLIVTSNFALGSFDQVIEPKSLAAALVDRLAHHAHLLETKGESIRLTQALAGTGVKPL
jgi:DNA replication protein DnaC